MTAESRKLFEEFLDKSDPVQIIPIGASMRLFGKEAGRSRAHAVTRHHLRTFFCRALPCGTRPLRGRLEAIHELHPTVYSILWGFGTALVLAVLIGPIILLAAMALSWGDEKCPLILLAAGAILEVAYLIPVRIVCHLPGCGR
jgi:hypothetical protein